MTRRLQAIAVVAGVLTLVALASASLFGPGPNSIPVPSSNQTLTVAITGPANNSTITVPPGSATLQGNCQISPAQSNCSTGTTVNVIYLVDVSGSTDLTYMTQNGIPQVDANGNGHIDPG